MSDKEFNWRNANPKNPAHELLNNLKIKWIFLTIFIVITGLIGVSTFAYQIDADSEAIVLRFGEYSRTQQPGLNFKIPFGIEEKIIVPVKRELKMDFGYRTGGRLTNRYQVTSESDQRKTKSMITGDTNAVDVEWSVTYNIIEPKDYCFNVREPESTMRDATESVIRQVVGDRSVDEVLTIGRQSIEIEAMDKLQKLLNLYELGIKINQVQLINVNPPERVKPSFNEVNQAQQIKLETINKAKGVYNREVPRAMGEAQKNINSAEGSAIERINQAKGDSEKFLALLREYEKAPKITRQRIYLENMSEILSTIPNKILLDSNTKNFLPFLNLNQAKTQILK